MEADGGGLTRDYLLRTNPLYRDAEGKAVRHVRTPEGADKYGQPIGSVIVPDVLPMRGSPGTDIGARIRAARLAAQQARKKPATSTEAAPRKVGTAKKLPPRKNVVRKATPQKQPAAPAAKVPAKPRTTVGARAAAVGAAKPKQMVKLRPATDEDRKRLRVPPAWTDVQVNDTPNARLLVRGRDAKGRVQSMYSAEHTEGQAALKFQRIKVLSQYMDKLDDAIERDAMQFDEAAVLMLIRKLGMRPGSDRNTGADKEAFGASNLQARHVSVTPGGQTNFKFVGKKGVDISLKTKDPLIAEVMRDRLSTRSRSQRLFDTNESRTRDYYRQVVPQEFYLKDLRTLHANVLALEMVAAKGRRKPKTVTEYKRMRNEIGTAVSEYLGNTRTVALASYINPAVFDSWRQEGWEVP